MEPADTHSVTVPYNASVLYLKEQVSVVAAVDVPRQRLIFQGRVLKDDKRIDEY
ncbi:hypothetical protein BZG36_05677, partial [Bifiguratus adelaidae]